MRRHHNDALARVKEQSEALLLALDYQKERGGADEDAVAQVGSAVFGRLCLGGRVQKGAVA